MCSRKTGPMPMNQPQGGEAVRIDRRRRHADDPTMPITVNIPISLRTDLDTVVAERNATRSGLIVMAIRAWLDRQEGAGGT
jgi:hypothetical protein